MSINIPNTICKVSKNPIFKVLILALMIQRTQTNISQGLLIAIAFLVTNSLTNTKNIIENMSDSVKESKDNEFMDDESNSEPSIDYEIQSKTNFMESIKNGDPPHVAFENSMDFIKNIFIELKIPLDGFDEGRIAATKSFKENIEAGSNPEKAFESAMLAANKADSSNETPPSSDTPPINNPDSYIEKMTNTTADKIEKLKHEMEKLQAEKIYTNAKNEAEKAKKDLIEAEKIYTNAKKEAEDTNISDTNVSDTDMPDTDMSDTDMSDTNISDTNMSDTDTTSIRDTEIINNDSGLNKCKQLAQGHARDNCFMNAGKKSNERFTNVNYNLKTESYDTTGNYSN